MEILKEAYWKLNRQKDALDITRKLADTYFAFGQYSSALLEYEGILQKDPNNPEVVAALGEVEAKLHSINGKAPEKPRDPDSPIAMDFWAIISDDPTLITTNATVKPEGETTVKPEEPQQQKPGNRIEAALKAMEEMGFPNEGNLLRRLLENYNGDISRVLDSIK